jgi:hypothetical protein
MEAQPGKTSDSANAIFAATFAVCAQQGVTVGPMSRGIPRALQYMPLPASMRWRKNPFVRIDLCQCRTAVGRPAGPKRVQIFVE